MAELFKIPLLRDHHTHPLLYAAFNKCLSLQNVTTKTEANQLIREESERSSSEIVVAYGWRSNCFDWTADELEALPPVAIFNVSLHSLKLNKSGEEIVRGLYGEDALKISDQDWYEDHFRQVLNWFANLYASKEALVEFYQELENVGVYFAEEMLLFDEDEVNCFEEAGLTSRTRFWSAPDTFETLSEKAKASVYGLKLFTDGALGARTAALKQPFIGDESKPDNCGVLLYSDEALQQVVDSCLQTGKALAVHAIGDRAIEQIISALTNQKEAIKQVPQVRVEHAQMIDLAMADRAKRLGITLSMQPNFNSDSEHYVDRLHPDYCRMNNPFRMLIDEAGFVPGKDLVFGSDGMPHGAEYALQQSLFPSIPMQRLSIEEFQSAYCLSDERKGSIEFEVEGKEVRDLKVTINS